MNEQFTNNIQIHAADNYAIQPDVRGGRTCMRHTIMRDGYLDTPRWGARPRSELIPSQPFQIGDTLRYSLGILIPADFDGSTSTSPVLNFHQSAGIPGVPLQLAIKQKKWISTGERPDWFMAFERFYAPEQWTEWVFEIKWSTGADGITRIYRDGLLMDEYFGRNCAPDSIAPYLKIGPQQSDWGEPEPADYTGPTFLRTFYTPLRIEKL